MFAFEMLLGRLLLRRGGASIGRIYADLSRPDVLSRAKHEYLTIFGGVLGTVLEVGPRPPTVSALSLVWRPAAPEDLPLVLLLWMELGTWIQSLPTGTLDHLRSTHAGRPGRRRFRRAYIAGVWAEAERLGWYHDVDAAHLARKVEHALPATKNWDLPSRRLEANFRNQRHRRRKHGETVPVGGKRALRHWKGSEVSEWFRALRPDFFEDVPRRISVAPSKPRAARMLGRRTSRARSVLDQLPKSRADAIALFPDWLLADLERVLQPALRHHRPRALRDAILGVLIRSMSSGDGWKALPGWLEAKTMTCQRLFIAIDDAGLWPEFCANVVNGIPGVVMRKPARRSVRPAESK